MKQVLWWLIAGSKGGLNRARIINALHKRPYNANQLKERLNLDYKTIRHHLDILKKHNLITQVGKGYGTMYFLSDGLKKKYDIFLEIWTLIEIPDETNGETAK